MPHSEAVSERKYTDAEVRTGRLHASAKVANASQDITRGGATARMNCSLAVEKTVV